MSVAKENWVGEQFEVEVGPVAHGGHFVARHEGRVLFVRHALPGERVVASVYEDNGGSFCRADAVEILTPSPDRVEAPCPFSGPGMCGGCDFQHVSWDAQRELKAQVVREQLSRLGKIERDVVVEALPGGPLEWRTRIRMAVDRDGRPGFRGTRSHDVIPVDHCVISRPGMVEAVADRKWRAQELTIVQDGDGNRHVGEVRGRHTVRRAGTGTAVETAAQRKWRVSADGFWQVHPQAADTFASVVGSGPRLSRGNARGTSTAVRDSSPQCSHGRSATPDPCWSWSLSRVLWRTAGATSAACPRSSGSSARSNGS